MKVLQFTLLDKSEFENICNKISYTFPSLEIEKVLDENLETDVTDHTVIVIGFGDNVFPFDKLVTRLKRAHDNGYPILFSHGIDPYSLLYDGKTTLTNEEIEVMVNTIDVPDSPNFTAMMQKASANALLDWRENKLQAAHDLGFSEPPASVYNYYSQASIKVNAPVLQTPYDLRTSDFIIQQTHSYGVKLANDVTRVLINPLVPDDNYNWHLAGKAPVGKGKIAYLNFGHNDFNRGDLWNDITIVDAQLFVNVITWLTT